MSRPALPRSLPRPKSTRISAVAHPLTADGYLREPERMVGLGFRYWMQGGRQQERASRHRACQLYEGTFGKAGGSIAIGALANWVEALDRPGRRMLCIGPLSSTDFCSDECVAISMIAACQHEACPALRACAFALMEHAHIDEVVETASHFADALKGLDCVLAPTSIVSVPALVTPSSRLCH